MVRSLVKKIETKYVLGSENDVVDDNVAKRVSSEVASMKSRPLLPSRPLQRLRSLQEGKPLPQSRPLHQLSIYVIANSQDMNDFVEKEKRTPKPNWLYWNLEFFLVKKKSNLMISG